MKKGEKNNKFSLSGLLSTSRVLNEKGRKNNKFSLSGLLSTPRVLNEKNDKNKNLPLWLVVHASCFDEKMKKSQKGEKTTKSPSLACCPRLVF